MSLSAGTRLGTYEIVSDLGAGGMGAVYKAHDATLARDVAIKVVHPHLASDPDRMVRFRREGRALAALNHPHVAAIHEFSESAGVAFLVMELVPGDTLEQKLARSCLTIPAALSLCRQVAAALEAAHEKGIVHRDLKPANIKLTLDGNAKVLDFGLAKALECDASDVLARSPTLGTDPGVVLGTMAYMSPEQARGLPVDRQADIWAFGCVLFEALTGRRAFAGPTLSDTLVQILDREPDWRWLPPETPPGIHRLLRRCLAKDPRQRLRDIGDARLDIEEALSGVDEARTQPDARSTPRGPGPSRTVGLLAAGAAAGLAAGVGVGLLLRDEPSRAPAPPVHFAVPLSSEEPLAGLDFLAVAISPDGSHIAYVAARGGRTQLMLRPMNTMDAAPLPGTTDAISPFFSPDGRSIGFFAEGKLKKVPLSGGPAVIVCDADIGFGGTWGIDDTIVFSPTTGSPLSRVAAAGGEVSRLTTLDAARGEFSHRWPELLPDGKTVLFTVGTLGRWDEAEIVAQSLPSGRREVLLKGGTHPRYLTSGHLLYARSGDVMVAPFDATTLALTGPPVRVLQGVMESFDGASQLGVSRSGSLVFVPGHDTGGTRRLVGVDSSGGVAPFAAPHRAWTGPRISPDGRRLAVAVTDANEHVWIYDIADGSLRQLTFEAENSAPIWTPDGARVTFSSSRGGARNLFLLGADGRGTPERLTSSDNGQVPGSWSPDGEVLAFVDHHPTTGRDIWMLRTGGAREATPFVATAFDESAPRFSPDGRAVAYVSNESGRNEVYLRPFPDPSQKWQVSRGGGTEPVWARDGRQLFYRAGDRLMGAPLQAGNALRTGDPRLLFEAPFERGTIDHANYDVLTGAQRFVFVRAAEQASPAGQLRVVLNWIETLGPPAARAAH